MSWTQIVAPTLDSFCAGLPDSSKFLLTEADLQRAVMNAISAGLEGDNTRTTVNSETPWHDKDTGKRLFFIDVTVFDTAALEVMYRATDPRKGYRYSGEAIALELKLIRQASDLKSGKGVRDDIAKMRLLAKEPNVECFVLAIGRNDLLSEALVKSLTDEIQPEDNGLVKVFVQSMESAEVRRTFSA